MRTSTSDATSAGGPSQPAILPNLNSACFRDTAHQEHQVLTGTVAACKVSKLFCHLHWTSIASPPPSSNVLLVLVSDTAPADRYWRFYWTPNTTLRVKFYSTLCWIARASPARKVRNITRYRAISNADLIMAIATITSPALSLCCVCRHLQLRLLEQMQLR